jgi:hypothetical protein
VRRRQCACAGRVGTGHGGDAGDDEEHGRQAEDQHVEHGAFNHGRWAFTWLRWRSSSRTRRPQREDWNDHFLAAGCLRVCGRGPRCDELAPGGRRRRWICGPAAVPRSRVDRTGLRHRRPSRRPSDRRQRGRHHGGLRGGRPAGQPDCAQPDRRSRLPLRGGDGAGRAATAAFAVLSTSTRRRARRSTPRSICTPGSTTCDARRDPARRHRAPAPGQDPGRRAVPDRHRVLRLQRGRAAQPH